MSDAIDPVRSALAGIAAADGRLVMTRLREGVATVVLDATGLAAEERAMLERRVRAALVGVPGVSDTRIAMTADRGARN